MDFLTLRDFYSVYKECFQESKHKIQIMSLIIQAYNYYFCFWRKMKVKTDFTLIITNEPNSAEYFFF